MIFTFVWAFDLQSDWDYVESINKMYNGELYIVELVTYVQTRLARNNTEHRKDLPNIGDEVKTKDGSGKVVSLDVLNKKYTILIDGDKKEYEI